MKGSYVKNLWLVAGAAGIAFGISQAMENSMINSLKDGTKKISDLKPDKTYPYVGIVGGSLILMAALNDWV